MPISYEQPGPFSSSISRGAGSAQAMAQTFGSLAQLYSQEKSRQVDANLAQAQLMQKDRQYNDTLAENKSEFESQQSMHAFDTAQAASSAQNHAVAQSWLNQQELSQQDQMRRQQLGSAVSAVEAERGKGLTDEQANDMIVQLKTKIDPLDQRMKMAQQRHMDTQNKLLDAQAEQMAHRTKSQEAFEAATMGDTFQFIPDAREKPAVEREVELGFGLDPRSPQGQQKVAELMKERGLGQRFFMNGGKKEMHPADLEALKAQSKVGGKGPKEVTAEEHAKTMQEIRHEVDKWAKDQDKPPSQADKDAEYKRRLQQHTEGMAEFNTRGKADPRAVEEKAKQARDLIDVRAQQIIQSPLPPNLKEVAVRTLAESKKILTHYKSVDAMPETVYKRYLALGQQFEDMKKFLEPILTPQAPAPSMTGQRTADVNARPQPLPPVPANQTMHSQFGGFH